MADGDEAAAAAPKKINLRINFGSNDEEQTFSVKMTTPFSKVYESIAKMRGVAKNSFKLVVDGHRIAPEETPKMLELEDETAIDYHLEQVGGRR